MRKTEDRESMLRQFFEMSCFWENMDTLHPTSEGNQARPRDGWRVCLGLGLGPGEAKCSRRVGDVSEGMSQEDKRRQRYQKGRVHPCGLQPA